jgi:geranylgeranyl pyrophosphate synthase
MHNPPLPSGWTLSAYLQTQRRRIQQALTHLPVATPLPCPARQALQHGIDAGGKRFRPLMVLACADLYQQGHRQEMLQAALAVECIHCASVMLDDLPCMDDARLRRGTPTTHRVFGEAQTILAAMALVAQANLMLLGMAGKKQSILACLERLNQALGLQGLCAGQSLDLAAASEFDLSTLEGIHAYKTGALFLACVQLPCLLAGAPAREVAWLSAYARNLGLAFQVKDDLLDEAPSSLTGKDAHQDGKRRNFVHLLGRPAAEQLHEALMNAALDQLEPFGSACFHLRELTKHIRDRPS